MKVVVVVHEAERVVTGRRRPPYRDVPPGEILSTSC